MLVESWVSDSREHTAAVCQVSGRHRSSVLGIWNDTGAACLVSGTTQEQHAWYLEHHRSSVPGTWNVMEAACLVSGTSWEQCAWYLERHRSSVPGIWNHTGAVCPEVTCFSCSTTPGTPAPFFLPRLLMVGHQPADICEAPSPGLRACPLSPHSAPVPCCYRLIAVEEEASVQASQWSLF